MKVITTDDNRHFIALSVSETVGQCSALLAAELFPDGTFDIYPMLRSMYVRLDQVFSCSDELRDRLLLETKAYWDRIDEQRRQESRKVVAKTSPLPVSEEYRINGGIV